MDRRAFLAAGLSALSIGGGVLTSDTEGADNWCAVNDIPEDVGALQTPPGDPSFTVTGEKSVSVYWQSGEYFKRNGLVGAQGVANLGGDLILLNRAQADSIDDYILLHELAHSLGFRHGDDDGIVDTDVALWPDRGDKAPTTDRLAPSTQAVASAFDAYRWIPSWDRDTLTYLRSEFDSGATGFKQLSRAALEFAAASVDEELYISHSHNGLGGVHDAGFQPTSDIVHAGQFYKQGRPPTTDKRGTLTTRGADDALRVQTTASASDESAVAITQQFNQSVASVGVTTINRETLINKTTDAGIIVAIPSSDTDADASENVSVAYSLPDNRPDTLQIAGTVADGTVAELPEQVVVTDSDLFAKPISSNTDAPPTDPDDDGTYEDVTGDDKVRFDDAVALAFVRPDALSSEQRTALDIDGDGDIDFDDAITLAFQTDI
jgi:hypothetical protein